MLRLPAFGLEGPWRDRGGFAQTMEQITGMAWQTGYDGGPPIIPGGVVDPMVGTHTALALVAALEHRRRTGEGQLVEMPMIEVAAAVTAEQVIDASLHGTVPGRRGAHGVYRCDGDDRWIAVDEASDPLDAARPRRVVRELAPPRTRPPSCSPQGSRLRAVVPAYAVLDDRAARGPRVLPAGRSSRRRSAGVPELADADVGRARRRVARARARPWGRTPTTSSVSSASPRRSSTASAPSTSSGPNRSTAADDGDARS